MKRILTLILALSLVAAAAGIGSAQAPIESELALITPVSKFIHDAALKASRQHESHEHCRGQHQQGGDAL